MTKRINKRKKNSKVSSKIIIVFLFLSISIWGLSIAKNNFIINDSKYKINLIIDNIDVTDNLKEEVYIQNGIVYVSKTDIASLFDNTIIYDEQYDHLITSSNKKIASLPIGKKQIKINSANITIYGETLKKDDKYYIPVSELGDVYNIKTNYIEENNIVTIDSLDKEYKIATVRKDIEIKFKPTGISRTVAKIKKGESLIIANHSNFPVSDSWARVRTEDGILGYIKVDMMGEWNTIREEIESKSKQEKSAVWLEESKYQVSSLFFNKNSNYSIIEILKDYKLREKMINIILDYIVTDELNGINIDLKNMNNVNREDFSRFLIELSPRLNEIGAVLAVDGEIY